MNYYKEFMIKNVSIIIRKKEKPFYRHSIKRRLLGSGFVYILAGSGIYTDKSGTKIQFKENDILLVENDYPYSIETENCEIEYITTAFALNEESTFSDFGIPTFFSGADDNLRLKVLTLLKVWENNSSYSRLECRLLMNEIFLHIRKELDMKEDGKTSSPVDAAVFYINKNYDREISLDELAELCLMSKSYFRSQFKKYKGTSPYKYREEVRISWAKKYLRSNLFSSTEIAEKLGYCDIYHFSKAFKNSVGISPTEYRRKKGLL